MHTPLARRLFALETRRQLARGPFLDLTKLPPDLLARISPALEAGTFPQSVTTADLRLLAGMGEECWRL